MVLNKFSVSNIYNFLAARFMEVICAVILWWNLMRIELSVYITSAIRLVKKSFSLKTLIFDTSFCCAFSKGLINFNKVFCALNVCF